MRLVADDADGGAVLRVHPELHVVDQSGEHAGDHRQDRGRDLGEVDHLDPNVAGTRLEQLGRGLSQPVAGHGVLGGWKMKP